MKLSNKAKTQLLKSNKHCKACLKNDIDKYVSLLTSKIHPVTYSGSGRYITVRDRSLSIIQAITLLGYKYTTGNDAPRGGASGFYIEISKTARIALIELSNL